LKIHIVVIIHQHPYFNSSALGDEIKKIAFFEAQNEPKPIWQPGCSQTHWRSV